MSTIDWSIFEAQLAYIRRERAVTMAESSDATRISALDQTCESLLRELLELDRIENPLTASAQDSLTLEVRRLVLWHIAWHGRGAPTGHVAAAIRAQVAERMKLRLDRSEVMVACDRALASCRIHHSGFAEGEICVWPAFFPIEICHQSARFVAASVEAGALVSHDDEH